MSNLQRNYQIVVVDVRFVFIFPRDYIGKNWPQSSKLRKSPRFNIP